MTSAQWSPDLSVGVDFIETDHKEFFTLLDTLSELIDPAHLRAAVVEKLDELIDFTRQHFQLEERVMEENHYTGFNHHRDSHGALLQELAALRERVASGETAIGPELVEFLSDWFVYHIQESDKPLGKFLQHKLRR